MTFKDFLIDRHAYQYEGLDDEMGESCEEWLEDLDVEDVIDMAETYAIQKVSIALTKTLSK